MSEAFSRTGYDISKARKKKNNLSAREMTRTVLLTVQLRLKSGQLIANQIRQFCYSYDYDYYDYYDYYYYYYYHY